MGLDEAAKSHRERKGGKKHEFFIYRYLGGGVARIYTHRALGHLRERERERKKCKQNNILGKKQKTLEE